jgi:hypothetical protein
MTVTGLQEKRPIKEMFSALQPRSLQATVRAKPSLSGGVDFDLYVGHVRPD